MNSDHSESSKISRMESSSLKWKVGIALGVAAGAATGGFALASPGDDQSPVDQPLSNQLTVSAPRSLSSLNRVQVPVSSPEFSLEGAPTDAVSPVSPVSTADVASPLTPLGVQSPISPVSAPSAISAISAPSAISAISAPSAFSAPSAISFS